MIDEKMENRRRGYKEKREAEAASKNKKERPKIVSTFSDLKSDLGTVTEDEWAAIPDIGDNSLRFKQKEQRYTPAPDSLLEKARQENERFSGLDPRQQKYGGLQTPANGMMVSHEARVRSAHSPRPSVTPDADERHANAHDRSESSRRGAQNRAQPEAERGRYVVDQLPTDAVLLTLCAAGDSVSGQTNVDPKGYLTDLNSLKVRADGRCAVCFNWPRCRSTARRRLATSKKRGYC